jgi:hypothetical protein
MQDPSTCSPPPSLYRSSSRRYASVRHTHPHDDPDWKIINGR